MAQSPLEAKESLSSDDPYLENWNRLSSLISQGRSFSGRERHCVFLNTGGKEAFGNISAVSGLDWEDDGRALAVTDWDGDGDLDLWMTQRNGPRLRFVRNDVLGENRFLAFRLEGVSSNRDAIGARVTVETDRGRILRRTLRAGDGFLSQSGKSLHFGLLDNEVPRTCSVTWPGSAEPERIVVDEVNRFYEVKEGEGKAVPREARKGTAKLTASNPKVPASEPNRRLVLVRRLPFPSLDYVNFEGEIERFDPDKERTGPVLVNLWASWCQPCVKELATFSESHDRLREAKVELVALSTDAIVEDGVQADLEAAKTLVERNAYPFRLGVIDPVGLRALTGLLQRAVALVRPLTMLTSFLLDREGKAGLLYFGPVTPEQLLGDVALLEASPETVEAEAFPFPGRNGVELFSLTPLAFAQAYQSGGYLAEARQTIEALGEGMSLKERYYLATLEQAQLNWEAAVRAYEAVLEASPEQTAIHVPLGVALWQSGRQEEAERRFERAEALAAKRPGLWTDLGRAHLQIGDAEKTVSYFERSGRREHLARALLEAGKVDAGIALYEELLRENGDSVSATHRLAWTLATREKADRQETERALELAKRLGEWTQFQDARALDTLAVAHAQAGEFSEAVSYAKAARRIARATGESELVQAISARIERFVADKPWRKDSS